MKAVDWAPPQEFDEYRLVRSLGAGGMGQVFLARDALLDRLVAVKFLAAVDPDPDARRRFLVEARAAARLQHPNVATVHRVGQLHGRHYIVSEYVRGEPLSTLPLPIPWQRARGLALELARGLAVAHRAGVLHRDLKLSNAILTPEGVVKLIDFGLAKVIDSAPALPPHDPAPTNHAEGGLAVGDRTISIRRQPRLDEGSAATSDSAMLEADTARAPASATTERASPEGFTAAGAVMGTPVYMAPETIAGEPATRQTDVYALGIAIVVLCSGSPPFPGMNLAELHRAILEKGVAPLAALVPDIDPRFAAIVDRCTRIAAAERFDSAEDVVADLERLASEERPGPAAPRGNPYRGLRAFQAAHRSVFFGRTAEVQTIVDRLRGDSLVIVAGDSGVGKSSVCRAGVLPLVDEGALGEGRTWRVATTFPGPRPLASLRSAISELLGPSPPGLDPHEDEWQPSDLGRALGRRAREQGVVLFIDQLEELVVFASAEEADRVGEWLGRLVVGFPGVRVLATVRSDFVGRIAALPGIGVDVGRALYFLRPMPAVRVREAVVGPAEALGVHFESERMVSELVESGGGASGGLPLLQFALAELWELRDESRATIPESALAEIGGVGGALARHADGVLAALRPEQRRLARRVLQDLVSAGSTRARRATAEIVDGDARVPEVLESLVMGRLLVVEEGPEGTTHEIAHEALLTSWGTLRAWLGGQSERLALRQRLTAAAAEWDRLGRLGAALWSAPQLAEASWVDDDDDLRPREREFLARSRQALRRRRVYRQMAALGVALAAVAWYQGAQLIDHREKAARIERLVASAMTSAAVGRRQRGEMVRVRDEAIGEARRGDRDATDSLWPRVQELALRADRSFAEATGELERALAVDGGRADVRRRIAAILYERAALAESVQRPERMSELLARLNVHDASGRYRARWDRPGSIGVETDPPGARVEIEPIDPSGTKSAERPLGASPVVLRDLPPGPYSLAVRAARYAPVRFPFVLRRGEHLDVHLPLLRDEDLPVGFVHVPAGRFLMGSSDDTLRSFLWTVPLHERWTKGFLIAREEVTFADWIAYLDAQPPMERERRRPHAGSDIELTQTASGAWRLSIQPNLQPYSAEWGQPIRYVGRRARVAQDWRRMPVSGIAAEDVVAYARWLSADGRVRGARLCTELEWERAARGADGRRWPHGDRLAADDANYDLTYARDPAGMGPDEVGSHPRSRSPFGVDDLAGNVYEWTRSAFRDGEFVVRGGSFGYDATTNLSMNREALPGQTREVFIGARLCADPPARTR